MNLSVRVTAGISLFLGFLVVAFAGAECRYCNPVGRDLETFDKYIQKTADYYEGGPRIRVDTLPKAKQEQFAATGEIVCPNEIGTAQLTTVSGAQGVKNIITTAAHMFHDAKTCRATDVAGRCVFKYTSKGKQKSVSVSGVIDDGFHCPASPTSSMAEISNTRDWAVVRLGSSVSELTPYEVDLEKNRRVKTFDKVVAIGHSADFLDRSGKSPKHFGQCYIGDIRYISEPTFLLAPCGCGSGCSGGSLVREDNPNSLVAIFQGNFDQIEAESIAKGKANLQHFNPRPDPKDLKSGYSGYVPIVGDFYKALEKAAGGVSL